MNDEKLIKICKNNKECFEGNEEVKILIELKNISNLSIKIFEFCPENYYLTNKKELDDNFNLEGLIASEEKQFTFNEASIVKSIKEFKFESITAKKRGIFFIEFIGDGMSSRVIIKKGKLLLLERLTLAGQVFTILDESLNICKVKNTFIIF